MRLFQQLITLPGLCPAAEAPRLGQGMIPKSLKFSGILQFNPVNAYLIGVGQGGGETPSCLHISSFLNMQGFP